jgi:cell division protein FtsI/penicillin-binding protein 2
MSRRSIVGRVIGFGVLLLLLVMTMGGIAYRLNYPRPAPLASAGQMYVLSTCDAISTDRLFEFTPASAADDALVLTWKDPCVQPESGLADVRLTTKSSETIWLGDLAYELSYAPPGAGGGGRQVAWRLTGARVRVGDRVGRAPGFSRRDRLVFSASARASGGDRGPRDIVLWMDSMPSLAFELLDPSECPDAPMACLRVGGGAGQITIERNAKDDTGTSSSSAAATAQTPPETTFDHLNAGGLRGVGESDRLWIGHLPFTLRRARTDTWELRLADRYLQTRGDRAVLGAMVFRGTTTLDADTPALTGRDLRALGQGPHVHGFRWNPETEDEYQVLIDTGLLCLELEDDGGEPVPQVRWREPSSPGCLDPVSRERMRALPELSQGTLDIYRRRVGSDQLVQRANTQLRAFRYREYPADLPFSFEWAVVSRQGMAERLPVRLWGIRTLTALSQAPAAPLPGQGRDRRADRAITLVGRDKSRYVLAATDSNGQRRYAQGPGLHGLGPLIGARGRVDGLDEIVADIQTPTNVTDVVLTIDPDLQRALWQVMQTTLPAMPARRGTYSGVSAVVLEPVSGDVLAVLNWPYAIDWQKDDALAGLVSRMSGELRSSQNIAMLREHSVGSTMKLLSIYAMLDAGLAEGTPPHGEGVGTCGSRAFGAMFTRASDNSVVFDPRAIQPALLKAFPDGQQGPLPAGAAAVRDGVYRATGHSCNTFFAFLATMLVGDSMPDVTYVERCPINKVGVRDDVGKPTYTQWVICSSTDWTRTSRLEKRTWLLLPAKEDLYDRAIAGFADRAKGRRSFFEVGVQAGYRLESCRPLPNTDPNAKPNINRCTSGVRGSGYEGVAYRDDWFEELGRRAARRVFAYPTMFTPGRFFGARGGTERFDTAGAEPSAKDGNWFDFASQAVGYAGRQSALSLAVLYAAMGRDDGQFPAPHLVHTGKRVTDRLAFQPSAARLQAMRDILKAPLDRAVAGTAATGTRNRPSLADSAAGLNILPFMMAKTGTFDIDVVPATGGPGLELAECGVLAYREGNLVQVSATRWNRFFGARVCEDAGLVLDGLHRYPQDAPADPPTPQAQEAHEERGHSSFVTLISPPPGSAAPPIIVSIVSDVPTMKAKVVMQHLLQPIAGWLRRTP